MLSNFNSLTTERCEQIYIIIVIRIIHLNINEWYQSTAATFGYCQTSETWCNLVRNKLVDHSDVVGALVLLQLHLHSPLNTWLHWIGQRQLQDKTRIIEVLGFDAPSIRGFTVFQHVRLQHIFNHQIQFSRSHFGIIIFRLDQQFCLLCQHFADILKCTFLEKKLYFDENFTDVCS